MTPKELHMLYKRFKVGLIDEKDLTILERKLLIKYYGVVYSNPNVVRKRKRINKK